MNPAPDADLPFRGPGQLRLDRARGGGSGHRQSQSRAHAPGTALVVVPELRGRGEEICRQGPGKEAHRKHQDDWKRERCRLSSCEAWFEVENQRSSLGLCSEFLFSGDCIFCYDARVKPVKTYRKVQLGSPRPWRWVGVGVPAFGRNLCSLVGALRFPQRGGRRHSHGSEPKRQRGRRQDLLLSRILLRGAGWQNLHCGVTHGKYFARLHCRTVRPHSLRQDQPEHGQDRLLRSNLGRQPALCFGRRRVPRHIRRAAIGAEAQSGSSRVVLADPFPDPRFCTMAASCPHKERACGHRFLSASKRNTRPLTR